MVNLLCAFVDGAYVPSVRSLAAAKTTMLAAMAISLWTSANQSPVIPGYFLYRRPANDGWERERLLQSLPVSASVWSHDPTFAHLGMNPRASTNMNGQDYLIFDLEQDAAEYAGAPIRKLLAGRAYIVSRQEGGLVVLRKT